MSTKQPPGGSEGDTVAAPGAVELHHPGRGRAVDGGGEVTVVEDDQLVGGVVEGGGGQQEAGGEVEGEESEEKQWRPRLHPDV